MFTVKLHLPCDPPFRFFAPETWAAQGVRGEAGAVLGASVPGLLVGLLQDTLAVGHQQAPGPCAPVSSVNDFTESQ